MHRVHPTTALAPRPSAQTSTVVSSAGGRLFTALAALPAQLLPQQVHVGRQVLLPRSAPAGAASTTRRRQPRRQRFHAPGADAAHDPLCPQSVGGFLASHRMISYRLRVAGLYALP